MCIEFSNYFISIFKFSCRNIEFKVRMLLFYILKHTGCLKISKKKKKKLIAICKTKNKSKQRFCSSSVIFCFLNFYCERDKHTVIPWIYLDNFLYFQHFDSYSVVVVVVPAAVFIVLILPQWVFIFKMIVFPPFSSFYSYFF